ncbi:MAG: GTPase HflX [Planctomycetota bacterium]
MSQIQLREDLTVHRERAVLVGVRTGREDADSLDELARLCDTAGADVAATLLQNRSSPDARNYLGSGKVKELAELVKASASAVVIADDDLSPRQVKSLEKATGVKVVDRSELILDIFSTHARTRQAKLQVEMAQLQYAMTRLRRLWTHLERQEGVSGGGYATRGVGEKQIEIDRRLMGRRLSELEGKLEEVTRQAREGRLARRGLYKAALVGYTNAGKSSLMRALTGDKVLVQDQLFSTLDTLTRRLAAPWPPVLLSDTVGFIRKLPRHLLSSFRSTLSEVLEADILLVVVDASEPAWADRLNVVHRVLEDIGAAHVPRLTIFNKIDAMDEASLGALPLGERAMQVSAHTGSGVAALSQRLHELGRREACPVWVEAEAAQGALVSELLKQDAEKTAVWKGDKLHVKLILPEAVVRKYEQLGTLRVERIHGSQTTPT